MPLWVWLFFCLKKVSFGHKFLLLGVDYVKYMYYLCIILLKQKL